MNNGGSRGDEQNGINKSLFCSEQLLTSLFLAWPVTQAQREKIRSKSTVCRPKIANRLAQLGGNSEDFWEQQPAAIPHPAGEGNWMRFLKANEEKRVWSRQRARVCVCVCCMYCTYVRVVWLCVTVCTISLGNRFEVCTRQRIVSCCSLRALRWSSSSYFRSKRMRMTHAGTPDTQGGRPQAHAYIIVICRSRAVATDIPQSSLQCTTPICYPVSCADTASLKEVADETQGADWGEQEELSS